MPQGLSAQEERAFAAIIRELEPEAGHRVRLWHLAVIAAAWSIGWVGLIMFVKPLALAALSFAMIAASTAAAVVAIGQVSIRATNWNSSLKWQERARLVWSNLRS